MENKGEAKQAHVSCQDGESSTNLGLDKNKMTLKITSNMNIEVLSDKEDSSKDGWGTKDEDLDCDELAIIDSRCISQSRTKLMG